MQIYSFDPSIGRPLAEFGSSGATITPILRDVNQLAIVACIRLEPHGVVGMHESVGHQLLLIVRGDGFAAGEAGQPVEVSEGTAVYLQPGEMHETRAGEGGLVVIVLEGEKLEPDKLMVRSNQRDQDEP
jgi:quercetin dioxygenase-like cupin family protein